MAETIRDVVVRIALKQLDTKLEAPDLSAPKREIDDLDKSVDEAKKTVEDLGEAFEDQQKKATDAAQKAAEAARTQATKVEEANQKQVDSFVKLGDSVFTAARGVAFLGASSDENFTKMLRTIAKVQGAFDLFKGTVGLIRGTVDALQAMRTAAAVAATANTALAVSNTAVATTGTAAAVAMTALNVALGPIGIAFLAIGAAVGLFLTVFSDIGDEAEEGGQDVDVLIGKVERLAQIRESVALAAIRLDKSQSDAQLKFLDTTDQQIKKSEALRLRLELLAFLDPSGAGIGGQLAQAQAVQATREELLNTEKRISEQADRQAQANLKQLDDQKKLIDLKKDELKLEEDRATSFAARVGRLDPRERREFERIAAKAAAGDQLTRGELLRAEQFGGRDVQGFTEERFGRFAPNAQALLESFGAGSQANRLREELQQLQRGGPGGAGGGDVEQRIQAQIDERKRQSERLIDTISRLASLIEVDDQRIANLEDQLERQRQ